MVDFLSSMWNTLKNLVTSDVNKEINALKHQVQILQMEIVRVWGKIENLDTNISHIHFRVTSISQILGDYKNKTDEELKNLQQILETLVDDSSCALNEIDYLLKKGLEDSSVKKQLLEHRKQILSIHKRAKNNFTRSARELNKRNIA